MAADEANGTHTDNRLAVWALSNTSSLSSKPALNLQNTIVGVGRYGVPNVSEQKVGSVPLADCVNDTKIQLAPGVFGCWQLFFNNEPKHDEVESPLDSSDSRMLSTVFDGSNLWGTLDTTVHIGGKTKAGVAYYKIQPTIGQGKLRASLQREGRVAMANNNATYGAIAMTREGGGALGFTLVGTKHYPSAAYVSIDQDGSASSIKVIAEGVGPTDGFSGYDAFSDPMDSPARPRWGDYGAAVADGDSIWLANEWISQTCNLQQYLTGAIGSCGGTRTSLANWATRISEIRTGNNKN